MNYRIKNEQDHNSIMARIEVLMKIDGKMLTEKQARQLNNMALAVQLYEQSTYTIPSPSTIEGIIELRMYEQKLKQLLLHGELSLNSRGNTLEDS